MASTSSGARFVKLQNVKVPESLTNGNKFIKWDDDSSVGVPVTLCVDPKGYILYWKDQNKEMDCLEMSLIRDTRTGKYAHLPKDLRFREKINIGVKDCALEDKIITICYGTDMVNVSFINFAAISKEIAKEWTDVIVRCSTDLLALNASVMQFLEKCYTRLVLVKDTDGQISIRNILKMFAQNKDDRKRVQQALEAAQLPFSMKDKLNSMTFHNFLSFYQHLCGRNEVDAIFCQLGKGQKPYLTAEQFMNFLNSEQRDSRLNEVLHPYCDLKKAETIIEQHETNETLAKTGHLSQESFLHYLLSQENTVIPSEKLELCQDMTQPLSHYFINSSHNTYLTGHQFTGKSSVEIYRQALLLGCRCVELDCWDGKGADEEPIITHGYTMCTEVSFKEVIEAINEAAFKTSDYPVILSFENHCSARQQAKMAHYCRTVFGDSLLIDPLDSHKLEPNVLLPSPETLRRKILIKNKKQNLQKPENDRPYVSEQSTNISPPTPSLASHALYRQLPEPVSSTTSGCIGEGVREGAKRERNDGNGLNKADFNDNRSDLSGPPDEIRVSTYDVETDMELSALVNYIQPTRFLSFDHAEKINRSFECTSFVENQATNQLKSCPVEFVNFNKRQLTRVYPKGTRVDSSNYMPQIFWNAGCQMVALNYQTLDLSMQLNLGLFEYNGRSGYILKPDFMRRRDRQFDPFAESTVDGIVAGTVTVKIISGQFLSDKKVGTYVEVDMFGLPADTIRRKYRTKVCPVNGINPVYDEEPFIFPKVILPNLAILRIAVFQENSTSLLGHRVLPVESLRPGFRHISLRNECNQPQGLATLFIHITVKDFIPDAFADLAAALYNPIAYQSSLEKHSQQLAVLEMDSDNGNIANQNAMNSPSNRNSEKRSSEPGYTKRTASRTSSYSANSDNVSDKSVYLMSSTEYASAPNSPQRCISVDSKFSIQNVDNNNFPMSSLEKDFSFLMVNLDDFKQNKHYQKIVSRFQKQLSALKEKNDKIRATKLQQQCTEKSLSLDQSARKAGILSFISYVDDSPVAKYKVQESSVVEQGKKKSSRKLHEDDAVLQQMLQSEVDLQVSFQKQLSIKLQDLVSAERDSLIVHLEKGHDQDVAKHKKKLDAQNLDEMKALAKKHKDKDELARVRREAMQKNIKAAVQLRQKLQEALEENISKVHAKYNEIVEQINQEQIETEEKLQSSLTEKCPTDIAKHGILVYNGSGSSLENTKQDSSDEIILPSLQYISTRL